MCCSSEKWLSFSHFGLSWEQFCLDPMLHEASSESPRDTPNVEKIRCTFESCVCPTL